VNIATATFLQVIKPKSLYGQKIGKVAMHGTFKNTAH